MDGVLADAYASFFDYDEREFGRRKPLEKVLGVQERESFENIMSYLYTPGFFRTMRVMEGSQHVVKELNKAYDLFIVSAAMEFPLSLGEKKEWLAEHFPFLEWRQLVFCGSKTVVCGDIMIDDHFRNLDPFKGKTYLFDQPHNCYADTRRHERVRSWDEIAEKLL